MAAFRIDPTPGQREDWALLQNGFITMFWRHDLFDASRARLTAEGYLVVDLDAARWYSKLEMLDAFAQALEFPDYFGRNLDAFVDCLRDVVTFTYGSAADSTGTVIALARFDVFASREPATAWQVLDILAGAARSAMLMGHRFIVILQSDDPVIEFDSVGATPVMWNRQESLDAKRGL